jgi:tight adherence protein B
VSPVRVFAVALRAGLPVDAARTVSRVDESPHVDSVNAVVAFSRATGAPRSDALLALADARDEGEQRERDISVGMASSNATVRVLLALPAITAVGAELFGFPVITFLLITLPGIVCLLTGSAFVFAAWKWMSRIRRGIPHPPVETGLVADLAASLTQHASIREEHVASLTALAVQWGTSAELAQFHDALRMSRTHGVPVSHVLSIAASQQRAEAKHAVRYAIELLPTRLLAPVGTLLLPAFVITTVIPVVAGLAQKFFVS